ncbi:tetratricopeptide repeat protein, partial [Bacillus cereus group sp. Bce027]
MNVQTKGNEQITKLLDNWYIEIRKRNLDNAKQLKKEIDKNIASVKDDQNVLLYHALLNFRYQYLMDSLSIGKDSFKEIESFDIPTDEFLLYYYHFFKAMHSNITGDYNLAKEHYEKAEIKLKQIPD